MKFNYYNSPLNSYIQKVQDDYNHFISPNILPNFFVVPKNIELDNVEQRGYGVFASHSYNPLADKHILTVWTEFYNLGKNGEYLLFHEFTHILDAEKYAKKNKIVNAGLKGFSEYHAAQVDLLHMLGATAPTMNSQFSVKRKCKTVGKEKTVEEILKDTYSLSASLFERNDFPTDIEMFVTALGTFFNYLGRRSICKMYAVDYVPLSLDKSAFINFFGEKEFLYLDTLMNGWLNDKTVQLINEYYLKKSIAKLKEFGLS